MKTKIMNLETIASTPVNLDVQSINTSFVINYVDKTDPENPKHGHYQESINLNFGDEADLNRILTEKPYIAQIAPVFANRLITGYDSENATAKQFKDAVKVAVTPPSQP